MSEISMNINDSDDIQTIINKEKEFWNKTNFNSMGPLSAERISKYIKLAMDSVDYELIDNIEVLDFGCGYCRLYDALELINKNIKYNGVDIADGLIKQSKVANLCKVMNDSTIPFEDNAFDFIIAYSVFTHLTEKQQLPTIYELARVLKSKGILMVSFVETERHEIGNIIQIDRIMFESLLLSSGFMILGGILVPDHNFFQLLLVAKKV